MFLVVYAVHPPQSISLVRVMVALYTVVTTWTGVLEATSRVEVHVGIPVGNFEVA